MLCKYLIKYNAELLPLHVKKTTQRKCARRNEKLSQHVVQGGVFELKNKNTGENLLGRPAKGTGKYTGDILIKLVLQLLEQLFSLSLGGKP